MEATSTHFDQEIRILFVTQSLGKGGAERLVLDIAQEFKRHYPNVKVKIVPLGPANDYKDLSEGLDIEHCNSKVRLSLKGKSLIDVIDFERIVKEFKPDVIHSHTYISELVSRENIHPRIAYFTHVHSDFPEFEPFSFSSLLSKKKLTNFLERRRMFKRYKKANNQFVTISKSIDDKLRSQCPDKWFSNIHLIHNGINFNRFSAEPRMPKINETIELISVGRLEPVKNHSYLIDVLHELKKHSPEVKWKLNILGVGSQKDRLLKKIEDFNLQDNVFLVGMISNVEDWLKKSHLFLHTSTSEPFGLVIAEAMASSLPIVSLEAGGTKDLVDHRVNGYVMEQGTAPEKFATKIDNLIHDQELYNTMAISANKKAKSFDISNCNKELYSLYIDNISARKAE